MTDPKRLTLTAAFLLAVLAGAAAADTAPPAPAAGSGLTIALLDLAEAPDLMPVAAPTVRPTWRTTFGSERQTAPAPKRSARDALLAALAEVDAVLIQGVAAVGPLRRLFPARDWRLVVSRRVTVPGDADDLMQSVTLPATTAIVVKARAGLRVTGRSHALRLEGSDASDAEDTLSPSSAAVRLSAPGHTLWLAAVALPRACAEEDPPCPALKGLDLWRAAKRSSGEPALIGGRLALAANAGTESAGCATYAIESDLAWRRLSAEAGGISPEAGKGCIVTLRLGE